MIGYHVTDDDKPKLRRELMTWQVYYTETGKSLRQMVTLIAASLHDAMNQAEQQLHGREIVILAAVQLPLKLQHGEC